MIYYTLIACQVARSDAMELRHDEVHDWGPAMGSRGVLGLRHTDAT